MPSTQPTLAFPEGFLWGCATAAHQVEGHNDSNDWWAWERIPGKISDGSVSGRAAGWWERAEEDFDRAAELGLNTLRLSVEWSRVEPQEGVWDEAALARYREMLEALRDHKIRPMVTLHHFTNPLWLTERGGWTNPQVIALFTRYVSKVVESCHDLCDLWCTINEPMVYVANGYVFGIWPPGDSSLPRAVQVFRHMVRAHGRAYQAIHELQPQAAVSIARHVRIFDPADPKCIADKLSARLLERVFNESILHALTAGRLLPPLGRWESVPEAAGSLDYLGINYYSRDMVAFDLRQAGSLFARRFANPESEFSMEGWGEVYPGGLYRVLMSHAAYGLPIYVTEVGIPDNTDAQRPRFILIHAAATHRAIREGVPVLGWYFWSLVDNFEWAEGYSARFGLIEADFETQARRLRESALLYSQLASENAITREMVDRWAPEATAQIFRQPTA